VGRLHDGDLNFGDGKYRLPVLFSVHRGVHFGVRDHSGCAQTVVTSCVQSEMAVAVTANRTVHCRRPGKVTAHTVHCHRPGKVIAHQVTQKNIFL
jgi:hypothetical protein